MTGKLKPLVAFFVWLHVTIRANVFFLHLQLDHVCVRVGLPACLYHRNKKVCALALSQGLGH